MRKDLESLVHFPSQSKNECQIHPDLLIKNFILFLNSLPYTNTIYSKHESTFFDNSYAHKKRLTSQRLFQKCHRTHDFCNFRLAIHFLIRQTTTGNIVRTTKTHMPMYTAFSEKRAPKREINREE